MLDWRPGPVAHTTRADTPLVRMDIGPDWPHIVDGGPMRYIAVIETRACQSLATADDLPSIAAAHDWCQARYRALLEAELAGV